MTETCGAPDPDHPTLTCQKAASHRGAYHASYTKRWRVEGTILCAHCELGMHRACLTAHCVCPHDDQ